MELNISKNIKKLFIPTDPWNFSNPPYNIGEVAHSMVELMRKNNGIGLAYNQTDLEGSYKIFCMRGSPENFVLINPRIVDLSGIPVEMDEACLSIPGLIVKKEHYPNCRVRFEGPDGQTYTKKFSGMTAKTVQHEMNHLNGIPFWDGISKLKFDIAVKKAYKKYGFDYSNLLYKGNNS